MGQPERPTIDVEGPLGGWGEPWPNVAEIARVLPAEKWTLVGGLMAQLHAIHAGLDPIRVTNDVDIVLHIETTRGVARDAASALQELGYVFAPPIDPRQRSAHRFRRGADKVDVVGGADDVIDVLRAEHAVPHVVPTLLGHDMVAIEGGTQALRRTVNARMNIDHAGTTVSVPGVFGAIILKAAAFITDSRDPERHLQDAAVLLCCLADPFGEVDGFAGSDRGRLATLRRHLPEGSRFWRGIPRGRAEDGQAALRILTTDS